MFFYWFSPIQLNVPIIEIASFKKMWTELRWPFPVAFICITILISHLGMKMWLLPDVSHCSHTAPNLVGLGDTDMENLEVACLPLPNKFKSVEK